MNLPDDLRKHLAALGKKGGEAKSQAKAEAARMNAKKPRPNRRKKPDEPTPTQIPPGDGREAV
jgi:hypothetical protein